MKILHTADWHIGQNFYDYDRTKEHLHFLHWLKRQVQERQVDVLLIAGDVFDNPNPSAGAQRILYRFLREVTALRPGLQIVMIAGNHDSGARLEAPNPLLEEMNVSVRGLAARKTGSGEIDYEQLIVPLTKDGNIVAWCLAVPYLRQGDYPEAENYAQGVAALYRLLYDRIEDKTQPVIAMGHLQATGAELSENDRSERTVIGGLEAVSPEAFDRRIAYTALGHLHRAQRVSGRENVRYAGAPLPMSFAEKNNKQGVTLVEITGTAVAIERIGFEPLALLLSIPAKPEPPANVLEEIDRLPDGEITPASPYLEVKVLITEPEPSLRHRIEEALQNKSVRLARISAVTPKSEKDLPRISGELQSIDPMEMASDIFRKRFGGEEMPDEMKKLLQIVIREAEQ
ncbi:MAG: exonuclease SbcCD subunit D C-terminal domain-containing protein [Tannerellaceae bacterium]|jgi:exonuclease SbcD|nr:exonuclease SbcCD subunit D C-terminal domain-containing protein [Tannerellaceae bacterium]